MLLRGILKMWSEASVLGDIVLEKKKDIVLVCFFCSSIFQLHSTLRRCVLGLRAKIDSDIYLLSDTFILLGKYFNKNIV